MAPILTHADDFEVWNEFTVKHPLKQEWTFEVRLADRFRDNATKAYHYYWEVDLVKKFSCGWSIAPGYRQYYRQDDTNHWIHEPKPLCAITKKWEWFKLKFENRNLLEYRTKSTNKLHYRNRFRCIFPALFYDWEPVVYDEVLFREKNGYFQNRFFAGIRGYGATMGYIRRVDRGHPWNGTKILYLAYEKQI